MISEWTCRGVHHFDNSLLLCTANTLEMAISGRIEAYLSYTQQVFKALGLDVLIPVIFRIPIKLIFVHYQLKPT
jgi:hypothetical protein